MNGERVREWLDERKMRPEALAAQLELSMSTFQKILSGTYSRRSTIIALASLMGIAPEELLEKPTTPVRARAKQDCAVKEPA